MRTESRNTLKVCQYCGKEFLAARQSSKFCGNTCRVAHYRLRNEYIICVAINKNELSNYRKTFPDESKTRIIVTGGFYGGIQYDTFYLFNVEKEYFHEKIKTKDLTDRAFESHVTKSNKPTKQGNIMVHLKF